MLSCSPNSQILEKNSESGKICIQAMRLLHCKVRSNHNAVFCHMMHYITVLFHYSVHAYIYHCKNKIVHIIGYYNCMAVLPVIFVKYLWEASKVYSSISSHCMNSFPALHS